MQICKSINPLIANKYALNATILTNIMHNLPAKLHDIVKLKLYIFYLISRDKFGINGEIVNSCTIVSFGP